MRVSLRYRLLVPLGVLLAGDAFATAWAASNAARDAEQQIAGQLRAVARTLTEPRTFPLTNRVLEQMRGLSGAEFLLVRANGTTETTFSDREITPPSGVESADLTSDSLELGPPVRVAGSEYRALRLALRNHPNEGGTLYIFYPESQRQTAVADAVRPLLLLGGAGGLVAGLLMTVVANRLVARIREVDRQTRVISAGDFRPMPLPTANDELRDLGESVNEMARRLAEFRDALTMTERVRVLGQFSGGLAHQLRNAVAGAKLALQLHATECPASDREPLDVALRQLARVEMIVRQFLDLGRPETRKREPCDLGELLSQAIALLGPQCRHAGTTLRWEPPQKPVVLPGDAVQLGHLLANLLGNALEAAGPGGNVEVQIREAGEDGVSVEIVDDGPGPPPEIASRLFDPFVTGKDQGIGLGLAVAKQAVDAHGGKLTWERRDGRTVFRVQFPAVGNEKSPR